MPFSVRSGVAPNSRRPGAASLAALAAALGLAGCGAPVTKAPPAPDVGWPYYGGDQGGQRFSTAAQITPANVRGLKIAWRFSTGDVASKGAALHHSAFENTPIMAGGRLYVCSPFNEVSALDPGTGRALWRFDPHLDIHVRYPNEFNCRGVAWWRDETAAAAAPCAERIFLNTNDRRLIALDAATGKACAGFGGQGTVDVAQGVTLSRNGEMQITSAPVVVRGVVVVGSSIDDNQRAREVSGAVRAFDARTGALRWIFDPLAKADPATVSGAANVWAPMSADEGRGLVFLPTSSPSPDFTGEARNGADGWSTSVVAVDAATGKVAWGFQTVHHDIWDYDNPAQPTLATITWGGVRREAVLQPTKQGLLFTLDRDTGRPVIPVEERKVPQGGAVGEKLSPTQPFPVAPRPLAPSTITPDDAFGLTPWDRAACRKLIAGARHEGLFTPPSTQGTIVYPFTGGGVNWGGLAFDPGRGVAFVNTSNAMHLVTLIPRERFAAAKAAEPKTEISPQAGARYGMRRAVIASPLHMPCNKPPWGQLHAVDMATGRILWEVPLGTTADLAPGSQLLLHNTGTPNFGGPIVTASGLVFIGAAMDNYLRAFDGGNGKELWKGRLPAGGQATPMTYVWRGRQYVVIAAGGHAKSGTRLGDQLVAFALPQ
ncbi:pyrroloquinoline quinone-dependent dehydrogenase [Caulobacter sp. KR2-114]|uniref:pyrroloquinoline quinone-dependent dehydrogenase n=1 Tax=Caulobacter sp. KR2-114 TaxID=3400912 RepID=UPI003C07DD83